jgi:hypothetical protein
MKVLPTGPSPVVGVGGAFPALQPTVATTANALRKHARAPRFSHFVGRNLLAAGGARQCVVIVMKILLDPEGVPLEWSIWNGVARPLT